MSAYLGAGIVSIAPYDGTTVFDSLTFVDVGNVSKLSVSFSEERKELKNYRTAAGGTYAAIARIDKGGERRLKSQTRVVDEDPSTFGRKRCGEARGRLGKR